jgi:hypothetical protein
MKKNILYIITILLFCVLFSLTQLIDTKILYLGFYSDSGDVYHNHKTAIQVILLVFVLSAWISIINFLKSTEMNFKKVRYRFLLSLMTILIIYYFNFELSLIFKSGGFNIYYDWRHNFGIEYAIWTIILTTLLTIIINTFHKRT